MPTQTFAVTKIQPPRARAGFIVRASLEGRLREAALSKRLILVVAPAGFGKTVALTRLVRSAPTGSALAWVAADKDDDLHRFLACLCAALEPFDLPWRADPDGLIASASRSRAERREVATAMLNALAACEVERGCIVLDDMHRIGDAAVFEFLDLLLERLPERWCILLSSRTDPPIALGRLRVEDEIGEFRLHDLKFDAGEIDALVRAAPQANGVDTEQLRERTQGWPAGLSMMLRTGAASPGRAPTAQHPSVMDRYMFDYLASEVLDEMPPDLRQFLLRCSVLPELTAARCASVSGNPQAALLLEEIDRRALFVSVLDGLERTLRLHDLFRDFLEDRLMREHPDEVAQILMSAAANEPDTVRRVGYMIRAEAWDDAAKALDEFGIPLIASGAVEPVIRLIEQFPPEMRERSATLALVRGLCGWSRWDWPAMIEGMHRARINYAREGDVEGERRALVYGVIALNGYGRLAEARELRKQLPSTGLPLTLQVLSRIASASHAPDTAGLRGPSANYDLAMDAIEGSDDTQLWYQCPPRLLYLMLPGMHAPLHRFVDGALRSARDDSPSPLRGIANGIGAWLVLRRGDVRGAVERIATAREDERWLTRQTNLVMFVNFVYAMVCVAQGRHDEALSAVEKTFAYFSDSPMMRDDRMKAAFGHYLFYALRLADALGDADKVRSYARLLEQNSQRDETLLNEQRRTLTARLAQLDGDLPRAVEAWKAAIENESAIDVASQANEARLRCAHALLELGRKDEAAKMLAPVFDRVSVANDLTRRASDVMNPNADFIGPLLAGAAVREALASTAWGDLITPMQQSQLRDWSRRFESARVAEDDVDVEHSGTATPTRELSALSSREHEVLQRIAAGDSNKLIARAFELSPHTVKRHVANILDKLALQSRGQAAAWFRDRV